MDSNTTFVSGTYMKSKLKRFLSGTLSIATAISAIPMTFAYAEEQTEPYPYTLFAASQEEGAITDRKCRKLLCERKYRHKRHYRIQWEHECQWSENGECGRIHDLYL